MEGEGIIVPIKTKVKSDNLGVGIELPKMKDRAGRERKVVKLGAKEVREMEARGARKRERLQQAFYGNDDLEKYLGPQA